MSMDIDKRITELRDRLQYIHDIFGSHDNENIKLLEKKLEEFLQRESSVPLHEAIKLLAQLEDLFDFLEKKLDDQLTPMDKVRVVRHPHRISLKDILENVYDNYTEIGGQDEYSIDPAMIIARAYITRRRGSKVVNQPVMVIGQEKGHGQDFRNGGSVKPWGNAKALQYMKVAETENIPIHTYVFTPGAFPVEDYPGAAQQIARNLYEMAHLKVPVISVFSEGGSGGAEAIALADVRLMLSHGYYSVISPEGAAAIESGIRQGERAPAGLVEECVKRLKITAQDNLEMGFIDRVIEEPPLGARPHHYDFYKKLRQEVVLATDEVFLGVKGFKFFRSQAIQRRKKIHGVDSDSMHVRWGLEASSVDRLIWKRYQKFRRMAKSSYIDSSTSAAKAYAGAQNALWSAYSFLRYDFWGKHEKKVSRTVEEMKAEMHVVQSKLFSPLRKIGSKMAPKNAIDQEKREKLTQLSCPEEGVCLDDWGWSYISPLSKEDRSVTCPNAKTHGCLDLWAPDLYGDFAGVCSYCGHHFPMEYQWFVNNIFDEGSVVEFNAEVEAGNPLGYDGFDKKLDLAKKKTGRLSSCITFEARIDGVKLVVALFLAPFRGGTVGAAEGEKFIRAASRARKKHYPFLAYVHGTAGIRIQEGTNGVIQMPRCTLAVRRYIEAGGLYVVLYDTNSYAGPLASFLGCSPYQFSVRSANIGFAGPGVIKETTGIDMPPDYHRAHQALARGHIQGIWDRRDIKKNLSQAFLTIGGRNLYYR